VQSGGQSDSAVFQVQLPASPRLQVGTGDPMNQIASGNPVPIVASGPIGSRQMVTFSTTLQPSTNALVQLAIGANFTDLALAAVLVVPPDGFAQVIEVAPPTTSITVYLQSVTLDAGPLATSNVQSVQLVP